MTVIQSDVTATAPTDEDRFTSLIPCINCVMDTSSTLPLLTPKIQMPCACSICGGFFTSTAQSPMDITSTGLWHSVSSALLLWRRAGNSLDSVDKMPSMSEEHLLGIRLYSQTERRDLVPNVRVIGTIHDGESLIVEHSDGSTSVSVVSVVPLCRPRERKGRRVSFAKIVSSVGTACRLMLVSGSSSA